MRAAKTAKQLMHDGTAVHADFFFKKTRPHGCQLLGSARALTIAKRLGSSRSRVYTGARGYRRRRAGAIFFTYDDHAPGSEGVWVNLSP